MSCLIICIKIYCASDISRLRKIYISQQTLSITFLRVQREWNMKRIFVVEQQESTRGGRLWLNTTIKTKCTIFWLWRRSANNLSVSKTQNWNRKPRHLTQIKSIFVISSHTNKKFESYVLHKSHGKKDFQRQVCILRDGRRSCSTRLSYQVFFYWSRPQKRWRGQNPSFFGLWTFPDSNLVLALSEFLLAKKSSDGFQGYHHYWMEWLEATMGNHGFPMVFGSGNNW